MDGYKDPKRSIFIGSSSHTVSKNFFSIYALKNGPRNDKRKVKENKNVCVKGKGEMWFHLLLTEFVP